MKKIILSISLFLLFFFYSSSGHTSYIIYLKTGGRFMTSQYWKEENQIIFLVNGGSMGIEKDTVERIKKTNTDPEEYGNEYGIGELRTNSVLPENQISEKGTQKDIIPDAGVKAGVKKEKVDLKAYQEKMARLKTELNKTLKRIKNAEINKDIDAKNKATEDNRKVSAEMWTLTNELEQNNGKLPIDWWEGVGKDAIN